MEARARRAGHLPTIRGERAQASDEEEDPTEECVACEGGWEASVAVLHRETHVAYLTKSLRHLSAGHVVLDASRCWLCYWIVHALALLGEPLGDDAARDVVEFLSLCQHPDGGFGAGRGRCRTSPQPTPPSRASPRSPPSKRSNAWTAPSA